MRRRIPAWVRLTARSVEVPCLIKGLDLPCWITARGLVNGYSMIYSDGRYMSAHRFAYMEFRGEIPGDLQLDHLCRNRACWNPWHVEPVTPSVNTLRGHAGMAAGRKSPMLPIPRLVISVKNH